MNARAKAYRYQLDKLKQERERMGLHPQATDAPQTRIYDGIGQTPDIVNNPAASDADTSGWFREERALDGKPAYSSRFQDDDPHAPSTYRPPTLSHIEQPQDMELWRRNNPVFRGHVDGGKILKKLNNTKLRAAGVKVTEEDTGYCAPLTIPGWD